MLNILEKITRLTLSKKLTVQLVDARGIPVRLGNVLIGIKTIATHKNNVELFPFVTDDEGRVQSDFDKLKEMEGDFVYYGLMDYVPIENALPEIEICIWSQAALDRRIKWLKALILNYDRQDFRSNPMYNTFNDAQLETLIKSSELRHEKEKERLRLYEGCRNEELDYSKPIKDNWDGSKEEYYYKMVVELN